MYPGAKIHKCLIALEEIYQIQSSSAPFQLQDQKKIKAKTLKFAGNPQQSGVLTFKRIVKLNKALFGEVCWHYQTEVVDKAMRANGTQDAFEWFFFEFWEHILFKFHSF